MNDINQVAVVGAGVIGASWAALFLASGRSVAVHDISPATESLVRNYIEKAWPTLQALGLVKDGAPVDLRFCKSASSAVEGAGFVQESVPEKIDIKCELYRSIEDAISPDAVVASSASGLTLTEMQAGWKHPSRFVLGHPFNPPHLIPLVEVMGNDRTEQGAVEIAEQFYASIGRVTIRVQREIPGHVANRLQAALWREAIHLVQSGVASVEDVDTAIWAGPGLRWAAMGPNLLFHLAAGEGGLAAYCERYAPSFNRWWSDMGEVFLDRETSEMLVAGVGAETKGASQKELSEQRDALIVAMLKSMAPLRRA